MDYVEAFQNLRTNNKWGRKSPHKAVLMLTVIQLFERSVLSDNEIHYDDALKSMYLKMWNRVFPSEPIFHSEAYLPFWYLQSDSFWHIVPVRGKEDILSLMRDADIKPSETKLEECVKYAELDEDLYFLMTLSSGRSSLKRILLETYTNLKVEEIDRLSESSDNAIDNSVAALSEYEKILSGENSDKEFVSEQTDNELVSQFQSLNEDIQIALNLQYYSFLKVHRSEREMFREVYPTVYDLYDKIENHPILQGDITPSLAFTLDNFLSDLKIDLMGEEGSMNLIDKIEAAVDLLRGNSNNNEACQEPIGETNNIESSENDIVEDTFDEEDDATTQDYIIENKQNRCCIIDRRGEQVFSSSGQLIRLNNVFYGINYTDSLFSMTIIQESVKGMFSLGRRIISAQNHTPLYTKLDNKNYLKQFKAVDYDSDCNKYYIKVDNRWYGSSGYYADLNSGIIPKVPNNDSSDKKDTATGSRSGKAWTREEEQLITNHFNNGVEINTIASIVGRTEGGIKARLAKLGLIEYTYGQVEDSSAKSAINKEEKCNENDFRIENTVTSCSIYNKSGDKVFSADGKLKYMNGTLYRFNLKNECFTLKSMLFDGSKWQKGVKKIVAYPRTELFRILYNAIDYCEDIEDIDDNSVFEECRLKVAGEWYCYNGTPVISIPENERSKGKKTADVEDVASQFSVKIGETLKIFPSQMVGKVVDLRIDKSGHRKIVVQAAGGTLMEIYDSKFLYQKQLEKAEDVQTKKKRARIKETAKDSIDSDVTEMPQNEPENSQKVIKQTHDVVKNETLSQKSANKKVRVGDRIKIKNYNASCRVIRIENFAASFKKLIVEFDDGRQDWIIDNPDVYTIV